MHAEAPARPEPATDSVGPLLEQLADCPDPLIAEWAAALAEGDSAAGRA